MELIQSFLLVMSLILFLCIATYAYKHKKTPGAPALMYLIIAAMFWSLGSFFEIRAQAFNTMLFWRNFQQIGVFGLPLATLYFSISYTMKKHLMKFVGVAAIPAVISLALIYTNELHHLIRQSYTVDNSPLFGATLVVELTPLANFIMAYLLALPWVSALILWTYVRRVSPGFRLQGYLIIISILGTGLVALIKEGFWVYTGIYIQTAVLYIPGAVLLFYALFRHKFFHLTPIARDKVFEVINEGIFVINNDGVILDANANARKFVVDALQITRTPIGLEIDYLFGANNALLTTLAACEDTKAIIKLSEGTEDKYLSLQYYPLYIGSKAAVGSVMIVNDITEQKLNEIKLKESADRDVLTRLLNRNGFLRTYRHKNNEWYMDLSYISVFMIDVDKFKVINDTYGHTNGDRILEHFAKVIKNSLRGDDVIGRIGGEEFAVILPGTKKDDAFTIAERMRRKIEQSIVEFSDGQSTGYTISIGVTENNDPLKDLDDILSEADAALYEAKRLSRNRTVMYKDTMVAHRK